MLDGAKVSHKNCSKGDLLLGKLDSSHALRIARAPRLRRTRLQLQAGMELAVARPWTVCELSSGRSSRWRAHLPRRKQS